MISAPRKKSTQDQLPEARCSYFDTVKREWRTDGRVLEQDNASILCAFDHLTSFGAMMQPPTLNLPDLGSINAATLAQFLTMLFFIGALRSTSPSAPRIVSSHDLSSLHDHGSHRGSCGTGLLKVERHRYHGAYRRGFPSATSI